ncbi:Uncharacterised protein [BD1-7 clade bacterium]|uniref:Esterase YqiA n=1 Tax=BD1-7 clade bacterium TaxID=2029982 RepID=A0A5S9MXX0_9GAMM|nr:Uncharacterised protein [BD1-7 clade bacterium]
MNSRPLIIYIHGFLSSAKASKAQLIDDFIQDRQLDVDLLRPNLACYPLAAIEQLNQLISQYSNRPVCLVGSSLGGFYARYLALKWQVTSVMINPAIRPYELMHHYLGVNENPYTGEQFTLTPTHMNDLKSLAVNPGPAFDRTLVLIQTADEVLNAIEASNYYCGASCWIESGGDHQFQGFERYLAPVFDWIFSHQAPKAHVSQ